MKIYCAVLINEITGDIDHCITSDEPITDSIIQVPDIPEGDGEIRVTWRKCFCEFDGDKFVRARDILDGCEMSGGAQKQRSDISATVTIKPEVTKFKNLIETDELKMKRDYDYLVKREGDI